MPLPDCLPGKCDLWIAWRAYVYGHLAAVFACKKCHYVTCAVDMHESKETARQRALYAATAPRRAHAS